MINKQLAIIWLAVGIALGTALWTALQMLERRETMKVEIVHSGRIAVAVTVYEPTPSWWDPEQQKKRHKEFMERTMGGIGRMLDDEQEALERIQEEQEMKRTTYSRSRF